MPIIKVPATSANLGPGFDCLGIALDLYDTFTVTKAERKDILHNVEEKYCTPDNLFLQAYHKGAEKLGYSDYIEAEFACDIPISRGLGSSAAMIISGLLAANALHKKKLTEDEIFQLACDMEGHPDNAAPALAGGFCAAMHGTAWTMTKLPLDPSFIFTALVPDFAVETKKARAILPDSCPRKEAAANIGHAIFLAKALETGNMDLLKQASKDYLHEPYRSQLITDFDKIKDITETDTDGHLFISGSGSTCLLVSARPLSKQAQDEIRARTNPAWKIYSLHCDRDGGRIL